MAAWQETIRGELSDISTAYLQNDAVEEELPVADLFGKFAEFVDEPDEASLTNFDVEAWRREFVRVAADNRTGELSPVMEAMGESERLPQSCPVVTLGSVALISLLVDCRSQVAVAPIGEATPPLVEAIDGVDEADPPYEILAEATGEGAEVARLTGLTVRSLDRLTDVDFTHPNMSVKAVSKDVWETLEAHEGEKLETLSRRIKRSADGIWTQADLTAYSNERKTGRPFEELLAALWGDLGYEETAVINDAGGDGGVDIVAASGDRDVGIEAKRYSESEKIRAGHVRNLAGTIPKYGFDKVYLVTSTSVEKTDQAATEASHYEDLTIIDGEQLANHLSESSLHPPVHTD